MYSKSTFILAILGTIVVAVVAITLWFLLKQKGNKLKLLPFRIIALSVILLEIVKQIVAINFGYQLFWLPLHNSSIPIFCFILATFLNQNSKVTKILWSLSISSAFLIGFIVVANPVSVYGGQADAIIFDNDKWFLNWHSVIVHWIYIVFAVLAIVLKPYRPKIDEVIYGGLVYIGINIFIIIMANLLDTNFSNYLEFSLEFLNAIKEKAKILFQVVILAIYTVFYFIFRFLIYIALKQRAGKVTG
jgi:hypothetical protein